MNDSMHIFLTEEEKELLRNTLGEVGKAAAAMGIDLDDMKQPKKPVYIPYDEALKRGTKDEPTCACEGVVKNAVPVDGTLTFTGYPDEILRTLRTLLDGRKIEITVDWTIIDK